MHIRERLKACQAAGTAVLATNFYNFEPLTSVLKAARAVDAQVLLQLTRSSIDYMGLEQAVGMGVRDWPTTVSRGGYISTTDRASSWRSVAWRPDSTR